LSKPGRLPESDYPVIQNGCGVTDFALDPFDESKLAVGESKFFFKFKLSLPSFLT